MDVVDGGKTVGVGAVSKWADGIEPVSPSTNSVVRFPVGRNRERCILWPDVGNVGGNNTNCWKVNEEQVKENVAVRESEVRKSEMEMEMEIGIGTAAAAALSVLVISCLRSRTSFSKWDTRKSEG